MNSSKGFTLIELLVVIAIIAILAAILFPVFAAARQAAKTAQTGSNLKQCATAVIMYSDDNGQRTPQPWYGKWFDGYPDVKWSFVTWNIAVYPFTKSGDVMNDAAQLPPVYFHAPGTRDAAGKDRFNWFGWATIGANERGLFGWWESNGWHPGRRLALQERLTERSMLIVTRDPRDHAWGCFMYVCSEACMPNTDPNVDQGSYYWNNDVWAAQRHHRERLPTIFGDTHAKTIYGGPNIYLPPNSTYEDYLKWDADHKAFWGSDVSPTR